MKVQPLHEDYSFYGGKYSFFALLWRKRWAGKRRCSDSCCIMEEGQCVPHRKMRHACRAKGAFFAAFAADLGYKLGNPSSVF